MFLSESNKNRVRSRQQTDASKVQEVKRMFVQGETHDFITIIIITTNTTIIIIIMIIIVVVVGKSKLTSLLCSSC